MLASNLLAARSQMAFTLGFHILLVPFGLCLPLFALIANAYGLRHNDRDALRLARRWSHAMGVLFAVGAVTGTVLSFELGVLWPGMLGRFGDVFGLPFAIEGIAFFLEAIFIAIYIFGWDRLPPRLHLWLGAPLPLFALAGGVLHHLAANSWMNTPRGFQLDAAGQPDRRPSLAPRSSTRRCAHELVHFLLAALLVRRVRRRVDLRGRDAARAARSPAPPRLPDPVHHRRDRHAAADDGGRPARSARWSSCSRSSSPPWRCCPRRPPTSPSGSGGHMKDGVPTGGIPIPDLASFLTGFHADTRIVGLDSVPPADRPPATIVHWAFDVMVGAASALALLSVWFLLRLVAAPRSAALALVPARLRAAPASLSYAGAGGGVGH